MVRMVSLLIVSIIMLGGVAFVAVGPQAFDKVLPPAVIAYLDQFDLGKGLRAIGGTGAPSGKGDSPADWLEDGTSGLAAKGPIAARVGNEPVFIDDVITGRSTSLASAIPAEVMTIRPILGCDITPPLAGTIVGHAKAGQSGLNLAMSTYDDADLAAAVQVFVNVYRETGMASVASGNLGAYQSYDVVVTETRGPVYLVLESHVGNRIWNIHTADGARIERVILLGGAEAGVANIDPVVPVEVMLADGLQACGVQPAYPLNDGHLFFQSMANGAMSRTEAEEKLAAIAAGTAAYDLWFMSNFGIAASDSVIGWDEGTMSVIGPVPGKSDTKVGWRPIEGAKIRTTQGTFFEIPGQVPEGTDFASRVRAIATTFAGGDLTMLAQGVDF